MKRITLLLCLAMLLAACQPTATPQPNALPPTQAPPSHLDLINEWLGAMNRGDIEKAISYLAENAVVTIVPPAEGDGIFNGHSEIRGWYEALATGKGVTTLSDCKVEGDTVTCLDKYADEGLKAIGVDFIEGTWVALVRDGKIQSYTFTMTPESLAKFPPPEPTAEPTVDPVIAQLAGIYKTTITPEESAYDIGAGDYLLELQKGSRFFVKDLGGYILVQGYFTAAADQIVFKITGGPVTGSCAGFQNTYGWTLDGQTLKLTAITVDSKCQGEKFFFTLHPFTKQP